MRPASLDCDPTAGERAREIHSQPEALYPVSDPMDPRWGTLTDELGAPVAAQRRIVDPADPASEWLAV